ncbi:transglycosylase domain-containing protein [Metabacillus iocasae]|uniref:Penicillin-binding protein 2A n=1 Tax=Priestia iocasae TaxID=2291674 RepID=A0ABS2QWJ2_9BACI|nr:PBP1A family penicillin-binding protein [Metabacillus iocasae]MBM7703825.1 penicillin-binding protein 2A [Metabacillus iocasae]
MRKYILLFLSILLVVMLIASYIFNQMKQTENLSYEELQSVESTVIYDKDGNEVDKLYKTLPRENVTVDELPEHVKMAFIATEDRRFYQHFGIDIQGILRAAAKNIVTMSKAEGASTITQQLARNLYLSNEKTIKRKVDEMFISIGLEQNFTKDQILELYVNQIYFGSGVYGIGAASKLYFNKEVQDLTISEAALLAGLPKAPSTYSPSGNPEAAQKRRNVVLKLMHDQEVINETEYENARNEAVQQPSVPVKTQSDYQAFIDYAVQEASQLYDVSTEDLYEGGYKIYTRINRNLQDSMNEAVDRYSFREDSNEKMVEVGMAAVDPATGYISALYGGRDYTKNGLNRANSSYQPGSVIKPLSVYGPALETGDYTSTSILKDEPIDISGYKPRNADNRYRGEVTMEEAIARSLNIPAVSLLNEIGVDRGFDFIEDAGITLSEDDKNLALALGGITGGFSPIELSQSYTTFANNGVMNKARAISELHMRDGTVIELEKESEELMKSEHAKEITQMLQSVVEKRYGTGRNARSSIKIAGKTGTTQLSQENREANKDAWFVGYNTDLVLSIHVGFDQPDNNHYLKGGGGDTPAELFSDIMNQMR